MENVYRYTSFNGQNVLYIHILLKIHLKQETPQCDETRFSTLQPSIDMTGIRNEGWQ